MKKNSEIYELQCELDAKKDLMAVRHSLELVLECAKHSSDFASFIRNLEKVIEEVELKISSNKPVYKVSRK